MLAAAVAGTAAAQAQEAVCDAPPTPCCALDIPAEARHGDARQDDAQDGVQDGALAIGVQIWPEHLNNAPQAQLLALHPSVFRLTAGPGGWRRAEPLPTTADMAEVRRYVARQFEARHEALERQAAHLKALLARTRGKLHLILWEPPFTDSELRLRRSKDDRRVMPRSAVPVMAKFHVAVIEALQAYGLPVDAIELANEPDGDWNIRIPLRIYVELLREVRREASVQRVALPPIAGPGASSYTALLGYLKDPVFGQQLLEVVDIVSVHAWDDRLNRDIRAVARETRRRLTAMGYHGHVAVTEFAPTFLDRDDRDAGRGANKRLAEARSNTDRYAAEVLRTKAVMLSLAMSPIIFWEYRDVKWGAASYGLVDLAGHERPTYRAFAQLADLIARTRPAAVLTGEDDRTFVFFGKDGAQSILLINPTGEPARFSFSDSVMRLFGDEWLRTADPPCGIRTELLLEPYEFRLLQSG
ncbi:hypothetical protein ACUSIJ_23980 [Pseudochelatococcus sp. B33]